jgi:hypothetical protein
MPAPKTLLALAGAASEPPPLHESAVLVIDAQNEYVEGPLALPGVRPALDRIAALLARARSAGAPVIHVRHLGRAGGLFDPDAPRGAIADPAKPSSGETVIGKKLPNAFADTELQAALAATGKRNIVVCGFMTHMCVSSTVRASGLNLFLIFVLGFVQLGCGAVLYIFGARHLQAVETTLIAMLESVLAPIWVWLLLGETPTPYGLAGGAIVFAAVVGITIASAQRPAPAVRPAA